MTISDEIQAKIDNEISNWINDEPVWKTTKLFGPGIVESYAMGIDQSSGEIDVLRLWVSNGTVHTSRDLNMPFNKLEQELEMEDFRHSSNLNSPQGQALKNSLENQALEVLWCSEFGNQDGSYILRTSKPGREDHLVIADVYLGEDGTLNVHHYMNRPIDELRPENGSRYSM